MRKLYLLLIFSLILSQFVLSGEPSEIEVELQIRIEEAESIVLELLNEGFNIQRANDTLEAAKDIFEVKSKSKGSQEDFILVEKYLDEIFELNEQAYPTRDEINYVYEFYNETKNSKPDMNLLGVDKILEEMQFEFDSERYDRAFDLSKKAYSKIVDIEGSYTAVNLAYQATTRTLKAFFVNNWLLLIIIAIGGSLIYIVSRNRIIYIRTKLKIKYLERERGVLEELIKETQSGYFEKSKISEASYRIRIKKFSDLTRDINRQIPLLKEELAKRKKGEKPFEERVKRKTKNKNKKNHWTLFRFKKLKKKKVKKKGFFSIFKRKKQTKIFPKKKVVKKKRPIKKIRSKSTKKKPTKKKK
jgi:hypothetical protein